VNAIDLSADVGLVVVGLGTLNLWIPMAWAGAEDKRGPLSGTWAPCAHAAFLVDRQDVPMSGKPALSPSRSRGAKAEMGGQEDIVIRVLKPASVLPLLRGVQEPRSLPIQPA
jgi:hypothetical protein